MTRRGHARDDRMSQNGNRFWDKDMHENKEIERAEQGFRFPVLVGDIGGTNARFAILVDSNAEPKEFPVLQTADYATIDEAIQDAVLDHISIRPRSAILAVAGPSTATRSTSPIATGSCARRR